jgi:D-alanyl-D-alanine carboxypeptidase
VAAAANSEIVHDVWDEAPDAAGASALCSPAFGGTLEDMRAFRSSLGAFALAGLVALVASPIASTRADAVAAKPKPVPILQRVVRGLVRHGAPGALAEVRTTKKIRRAAAGVAQRQPRVLLRATDRFRVASITKAFVATVVLELVGEGKLALEDTVEKWRPGLVPNGGAITIRELLNHTSGLYDFTEDLGWQRATIADPHRVWGPRELVAVATSHPPYFAPGTDWRYSNTNYIVLGLVIEAGTGSTVGDQLRNRLFGPLGLGATSFPSSIETDGRLVHGYIGPASLPTLTALFDVTSLLDPSGSWAAGAMLSNADDLTTFFARLLGGRVLRPDLLTSMRTVTPPAENYGLGLMRIELPCGRAFGHQGDVPGYRTVVLAQANGTRVAVVMVNVDETHVAWAELMQAASDAYCYG